MFLREKIGSSKTIAILILQYFIMHMYMKDLAAVIKMYDYPCAPWVMPFYFSSAFTIMITCFMVVYLFSDVPFFQYYNSYKIIRMGRIRYAVKGIYSIAVLALGYTLVTFILSVICLRGRIDFSLEWGKLLSTISLSGQDYGIYMDISYKVMSRFSPVQLMMITASICFLVVLFIGMLMYAVSMWFGRIVAVVVALVLSVAEFFVHNGVPVIAKNISYFIPTSWLYISRIDTTVYTVKILPPLWYMYLFLILGIIICSIMIIIKSKNVEYNFYKED